VHPDLRVPIVTEGDVITARQSGRQLAQVSGLSGTDVTLVATAISEVARNILSYAGEGEVVLSVDLAGRRSLVVIARDEGPGIEDTELAMQDGFSTGSSLGIGLPGARRLMDEFELVSKPGAGTRVTMRKWLD
jgi:serine/threonine-protein kinase RsbT